MSTPTESPALPPMDTDAAPRVWVKKLTDKFFTRERLILLAQDLQIPDVDWSRTKMKKPDITQLVRKTLTDQPELAMDPRFVGLLVYRTSSATDGTGRGPHNGLTSAGKDAADVQEEANTKKQITPAHRVLEKVIKTADPPGRQMSFQTSATAHAPPPADGSPIAMAMPPAPGSPSDSDVTSPAPTTVPDDEAVPPPESIRSTSPVDPPVDPAEEDGPTLPSTPRRNTRRNICINVRHLFGNEEPEELWIQSGPECPVQRVQSSGGGPGWYTAKLSDMLPAALAASTPMKKRRGRIYRPPVRSDGGNVDIGSIAALVSGGNTKQLALSKVNTYRLEETSEGDLRCQVFLKPEELTAAGVAVSSRATKATDVSDNTAVAAAMLGDSDDHEIATSTGKLEMHRLQPQAGRASSSSTNNGLVKYIARVVGADDFKYKKATTAEEALKRYRFVRDAIDLLDDLNWSNNRKGGFVIPWDNELYPGAKFTRELVYTACGISRSVATQDASLFRSEGDPALSELADWVEDPEDPGLKKKFGRWTPNMLGKWKDAKKENRASGSGVTKARSMGGGDERGGKGKTIVKGKGKGKRTYYISSDSEIETTRRNSKKAKHARVPAESDEEEGFDSDNID